MLTLTGTHTNVKIKSFNVNGIESNILTIPSVGADTTADQNSDFSISLQGPYINSSQSTAANFTITGLDSDAKAEMTITDTAGTTVVVSDITADGTVDVSSLTDGALTVSYTVTDTAGNTVVGTATGTTLDTTADVVRSFKFVDSEGGTGNYLDKITNSNFIYFDD